MKKIFHTIETKRICGNVMGENKHVGRWKHWPEMFH